MHFCVRLGQFIPVLLAFVVLGLVSLQYQAKTFAGKSVSEITFSVWSGM